MARDGRPPITNGRAYMRRLTDFLAGLLYALSVFGLVLAACFAVVQTWGA